MTTPVGNRISDVKFEEGFTGNGKVFVHVEKQADSSERLVIYESNNALTAFFSNLFRNRSDTFTLREWAHRKLGDLPETFDKQRLTKNIKQLASKPCVETAPEILNKLILERKLDADETSVSKSIRFLPLGKTAFAIEIEKALHKLSDINNLTHVITEVVCKHTDGEIYTFYFEGNFSKQNPPTLPENYVSFVEFYSPNINYFGELKILTDGQFSNAGQFKDIKNLLHKLSNSTSESGLRDHQITKNLASCLYSKMENQVPSADTDKELTLLAKLLLEQEKKHPPSAPDSSRFIRSLELTLEKLDT